MVLVASVFAAGPSHGSAGTLIEPQPNNEILQMVDLQKGFYLQTQFSPDNGYINFRYCGREGGVYDHCNSVETHLVNWIDLDFYRKPFVAGLQRILDDSNHPLKGKDRDAVTELIKKLNDPVNFRNWFVQAMPPVPSVKFQSERQLRQVVTALKEALALTPPPKPSQAPQVSQLEGQVSR
jgi:hypothetical protein